jgi:hypothetical protein
MKSQPFLYFGSMAGASCTFASTGIVRRLQPMLHCHTCVALVCAACANRCHVGHYIKPSGPQLVYCQCGSGGACRAGGGLRLSDTGTKYTRRMNLVRGDAV